MGTDFDFFNYGFLICIGVLSFLAFFVILFIICQCYRGMKVESYPPIDEKYLAPYRHKTIPGRYTKLGKNIGNAGLFVQVKINDLLIYFYTRSSKKKRKTKKKLVPFSFANFEMTRRTGKANISKLTTLTKKKVTPQFKKLSLTS